MSNQTNQSPSVPSQIVGKINFPQFFQTIGTIPSSYKECLTYEAQINWFVNFLQNILIPTVNENGQAVEELQGLYEDLRIYVENYKDYIDEQFDTKFVEDINNKIDQLAQDGTLGEIISQYINLNLTRSYTTLQNMKGDSGLSNLMKARTLGYYQINDGGGSVYIIRDTEPQQGYFERLNNGKYAELIIENNTVSPEQFGAYGDNQHDDSQAIQKALDFNGLTSFNSKTYLINTGLSLNVNNKKVIGHGRSTIIKANSTMESMLYINKKMSFTIKDISLNCDKKADYGIYQPFEGGDIFSLQDSLVSNILVEKANLDCIKFGYFSGIKFEFIECRYAERYGFDFGCADSNISNSDFWDCKTASLKVSSGNNKISNVKVSYGGTANDYTTAGAIISGGKNLISNIEAQDCRANGFIISGNNNIISGMIADGNGKKSGDTGSSGLILNGEENIISIECTNSFEATYPNIQHYSISGSGKNNKITLIANGYFGDNSEMTLSKTLNTFTPDTRLEYTKIGNTGASNNLSIDLNSQFGTSSGIYQIISQVGFNCTISRYNNNWQIISKAGTDTSLSGNTLNFFGGAFYTNVYFRKIEV